MAKIAPSILSADFANLERDIHDLERNGADWVHVDIMDGIFVPNISIGIPVVQALRPVTDLPLDVHLMIDRPIRYVEQFVKAGADWLTSMWNPTSLRTFWRLWTRFTLWAARPVSC